MLLKFRNKSKKKLWRSTIALDFPDMTLLCRVLLRQPCSRLSINPSTFTLLSVEKQKCSEIFQRVPLSNFGGAGDGRGPYKAAALGHARPQGARPHVEPPKQRITLPVPVQVKKSPYLILYWWSLTLANIAHRGAGESEILPSDIGSTYCFTESAPTNFQIEK